MHVAAILKVKGRKVVTTTADKSLLDVAKLLSSMTLAALSSREVTARSQASCRSATSCGR